jgi:hypothetical protein
MGLNPIKHLLGDFLATLRSHWLEYRLGSADVLSPYAAELVIRRATLKGLWK